MQTTEKTCDEDLTKTPESHLTETQRKVIRAAMEGKNLFVTGAAGTGKSYLIEQLHKELTDAGKEVAITASTGMAAININGTTLHSFGGMGIAEEEVDVLLSRARKSKYLKRIWKSIDTLIIDEISILHTDYFSKADQVVRLIRNSKKKPFGGIQMILIGDFFQLPPVTKRGEEVIFCFELPIWKELIHECIRLEQVFRQQDKDFVALLERARVGRLSQDDIRTLNQRVGKVLDTSDGIEPTVLFPRLAEVDVLNQQRLNAIVGKEHLFTANVGYAKITVSKEGKYSSSNPATTKTVFLRLDQLSEVQKKEEEIEKHVRQLEQCRAAENKLTLKVGAQVLLTVNLSLEQKLVNGSRGVVTGFTEEKGEDSYPIVKFAHQTLVIRPYMWKRYVKSQERISMKRFHSERFENNYVYLTQIPLRLAYALSIHRVQGLSLDKVTTSLDENNFAQGQAYTALSRARSLQALSLIAFVPQSIRAHPKVVAFHEQWGDKS